MDERTRRERYAAQVRGCLLGGAVGDALGAPVEFWSLDRIRAEAGDAGVCEYLPHPGGGHGLVTDDTQMTLFTVRGLISAGIRRDRGLGLTIAVLDSAYDRWLDTQLRDAPDPDRRHLWLDGQPWLYARRAPGTTCLDALTSARAARTAAEAEGRGGQYGQPAANRSKGCGAVMRSAPIGLLPPDMEQESPRRVFDLARQAASYTHGHPTAQLASGALAATVNGIVGGMELEAALDVAAAVLAGHGGHEETTQALAAARRAATDGSLPATAETVESLGEGWVAEEALAIAVYAALVHPGPDEMLDALSLAVTHSGDSDSTGAICGNILGALHGDSALPPLLAFEVEGRGTILELAGDFVLEFSEASELLHGDHGPHTRWRGRY